MSNWSPYDDDSQPNEGMGCLFHVVLIGLGYVFVLLCIHGCFNH
jgi:hypothetical protein